MKTWLGFLAVVGLAVPSYAQYLEDYFQATPVASWARYELKLGDEKGRVSTSSQTLSRLPDQSGNVVIEVLSEPQGGKKKDRAMTLQVHARPGFLREKNPLNFMAHVERIIQQQEGGKAQELPIELFRAMGMAGLQMLDYSQNVKSLGQEEVEGRETTHYTAKGTIQMKVVFKELRYDYAADLWLSKEVPFGRVKERTVMTDSKGRLRSTTDSRLIASGKEGAASRITGPIEKIEMPPLFGN